MFFDTIYMCMHIYMGTDVHACMHMQCIYSHQPALCSFWGFFGELNGATLADYIYNDHDRIHTACVHQLECSLLSNFIYIPRLDQPFMDNVRIHLILHGFSQGERRGEVFPIKFKYS